MTRVAIALVAGALLSAAAQAQIDPNQSGAFLSGGPATLLVCPAGDGQDIMDTSAKEIIVFVVDISSVAVTGLTGADFEVDGMTPGAVTDMWFPAIPRWNHQLDYVEEFSPGAYRLVGPLHAGGYDADGVIVKVRGVPMAALSPLPIAMNSPDINGSGAVDLSDVVLYAGALGRSNAFEFDFNGDGQLNLADLPILVQHIGCAGPVGSVGDPVD